MVVQPRRLAGFPSYRDKPQTMYVAILPGNAVETATASRVASVIGKDVYGTRLLLAGRVPKIVARYDTLQAAELAVLSLRDLGLTATSCDDSDLTKPPQSFLAYSLRFGQDEATFWNRSTQTLKMTSAEAFLILYGRLETSETKEVTKTKSKLNVALTLLTGGIPVRRKVPETSKETEVRIERFLRLYGRKSADSNIEIRQSEFDYANLAPKIGPSSPGNFSGLVTIIRNAFPQAIFDDSLAGNYGLALPYIAPQENIEVLSRLIYKFARSSKTDT